MENTALQENTIPTAIKYKSSGELPKTLEEVVKWSGSYYQIAEAIRFHNKKNTEHYLITGCLLCKAEKQQIWKHDGTNAKNLFEWAEREMGIKRTSAQRMILVWRVLEKYISGFSALILAVDFTKLALIAPVIAKMTDDDDVIEMIHSAETNSFRALECNIAEKNGGTAKDSCLCDGAKKVITVCRSCGRTIKIEEA